MNVPANEKIMFANMILQGQNLDLNSVLCEEDFVIPRNNERWYGSVVRSTAHEISKENAVMQSYRESLDFFSLNLHSECIKTKDEKLIFLFLFNFNTFLLDQPFDSAQDAFKKSRRTFIFLQFYFLFHYRIQTASSLDSCCFIEIEFRQKIK